MYSMMLKCNVCIAQCLLVGYYKSSDQSNKVDQFSTTEKRLFLTELLNEFCDFLICKLCPIVSDSKSLTTIEEMEK